MATFVLIHGSMHGAWCWRDLVPELERLGHLSVAPNLPCDDAQAGLDRYAEVVEHGLRDLETDAPIFLVGHSLGSRTVPVVAAAHPNASMIFLCSAPTPLGPVDPAGFSEMVSPAYAEAPFDLRPDGARRISLRVAAEIFFHDCDEATASWAASQLRWQGPKPLSEPSPLSRWPDRPTHIVGTTEDRVTRSAWLTNEAREWLGGRPPLLMPGGHSPMLSQPADLAAALDTCTNA